ncbi:MAG: response regulator [Litorilinea sp.]
MENLKPIWVLAAEDDPDDRLLVREAFAEAELPCELDFVEDGNALLDYLLGRGDFADRQGQRPRLILLDLNMPGKDGREALAEIKAHPKLRRIPVVVMTTSKAEQDIIQSYELGVSSFIVKPLTFDGLVDVVRTLGKYWLSVVELPPDAE